MGIDVDNFPDNIKRVDYSLEEENRVLRTTISFLKKELDRLRNPPLVLCDVVKVFDDKAVVRLPNSNKFLVNISEHLIGKVNPNDRVLAEQKTLNVVDMLNESKQAHVESFIIIEKPDTPWQQVGGLEEQIREIKEVVELPIKNPELFKKVGITPPKGILLYGPPGTGKTLLAKAVASSTNSTFIEIVGSELVQKFIGEGAKLVKDIFDLARERAPSIIFIDELDAIASERVDVGTSGEREVQRTFMQLLSEIDGFKCLERVKVIGATNRIDILDQAVLRPGRFDRLIHVPLPGSKGREEIFKIHTKDMKLDNVDFEMLVAMTEGFSGAEIFSACTEAGYHAIRKKRVKITNNDFISAIRKVSQETETDTMNMFG